MDFKYTPFFSEGAFDFLSHLDGSDRKLVLLEIRILGNHPSRDSHFSEQDNKGRDIQGILCSKYCILYWADHAEKEIKITQIRYADK